MRKKILYYLIILFMLSLIWQTAVLAESDYLSSARHNIVRVESICFDGNTEIYDKKEYTGFLVQGSGSDVYVITIYDGLEFTSDELENIRRQNSLEAGKNVTSKLDVVLQGDLHIDASFVNTSPQRNLSILRLEQAIVMNSDLEFSSEKAEQGDKITLLAFPETTISGGDRYDAENVKTFGGFVTGKVEKEGIRFLRHDIQTPVSCEGGPLLNADGQIYGMLLSAADDLGIFLESDEIQKILDLYGISYSVHQENKIRKYSRVHLILAIVIAVVGIISVYQIIHTSSRENKKEPSLSHTLESINARLLLLSEKRSIPITNDHFIIGTSPESDLVLSRAGISRRHAVILYENKKFYIVDLNSTNGTRVGKKQLRSGEKVQLKDQQTIKLGNDILIIRYK